jgi:hypothetical protein
MGADHEIDYFRRLAFEAGVRDLERRTLGLHPRRQRRLAVARQCLLAYRGAVHGQAEGAKMIERTANHLSLISHPGEIARLILEAAGQPT